MIADRRSSDTLQFNLSLSNGLASSALSSVSDLLAPPLGLELTATDFVFVVVVVVADVVVSFLVRVLSLRFDANGTAFS